MDAQTLQQTLKEQQDRLEAGLEEARDELSDLNERVIDVIKRRPGTCLLIALAAGFVIGRMASR
jgi:ElaB/YqjD/DUF883 family membrane-anchored ribosome-binding protein